MGLTSTEIQEAVKINWAKETLGLRRQHDHPAARAQSLSVASKNLLARKLKEAAITIRLEQELP